MKLNKSFKNLKEIYLNDLTQRSINFPNITPDIDKISKPQSKKGLTLKLKNLKRIKTNFLKAKKLTLTNLSLRKEKFKASMMSKSTSSKKIWKENLKGKRET